jgi:hypothetical protein
MGKWGKWLLLFFVAMAFAVPAWAVDLKLGGKYEIQGRYYHEWDIKSYDTNDTSLATTMYLKHYFNLYPTLIVTDKISVKADIELFDNTISKNDSRQWYDKSSRAAPYSYNPVVQQGERLDAYDLFTVNELYVDAITAVGMFRAGKTRDFNGIGWFIQLPPVPDWTFGLVWNKKDENADKNSYLGYTTANRTAGTTAYDGSDAPGVVTNHDNADVDEFGLIANYAKDAIDFKGTLAYKHAGKDNARTSIWYPYAYFNYAITKDLKFNSKFGFATGPLLDKDSPVAHAIVAEAIEEGTESLTEQTLEDMHLSTTEPQPGDFSSTADYITAHDTWLATYNAIHAVAAAQLAAAFPNGTIKKDWEVDNGYGVWLGMGYTMDALKIQGDVVYLTAADEPQKISAYLEDKENLDTWLMNDLSDYYGAALETPATISALGDPLIDGNYSFAGDILARLNLAYKFTDKLDANLNLVWGEKQNVDYLENWNYTLGVLNAMDPAATKVGGDLGPDQKAKVDKGIGWEARARINYALQDNLSVGLDLCYYAPGDYYKDYIEKGFSTTKIAGVNLENAYAARWKATVKF